MGGKVAMAAALRASSLVTGVIVVDIAPVAYHHCTQSIAAALLNLPLMAGLTRAGADAALTATIPDQKMRQFLLQNFVPGSQPGWRIGLQHIAQSIVDIEGFPSLPDAAIYTGPTLFLRGSEADFIRPEHSAVIEERFPSARIQTLTRSGHWVHTDQPAAFIDAIDRFLMPLG
jgi:pimeloyl-ACP methyl ester carboxylesterase